MRIYSYLFEAALALVMLALSVVAWLSGHPLNIWVLPWQGDTLTTVMFAAGLGGLIITLMAVRRLLPILFVLWSVTVVVMLVRGFFFSSYTFGPMATSLTTALLLIAAALLAALGSLFALGRGLRSRSTISTQRSAFSN
jgi:hypothetical protein